MLEVVHFSIKVISITCTVLFNVPKVHKNHLICLNYFILASHIISNACTCIIVFANVHFSIQIIVQVHKDRFSLCNLQVINGEITQLLGIKVCKCHLISTVDIKYWDITSEKCAFETNAAIAQISIRPY